MVMSILRPASGALLASILILVFAGASVAKSKAESTGSSGPALEGTEWALQQLAVDAALTDVSSGVVATLFLRDGQASGAAGCNTFSGDYSIDGDALSFGPIRSTMMICEGEKATTEASYLASLPLVASYSVDGETLSLLDGSRDPVLTYAAITAQPIVGSWVVTSYNTNRNDMAPPITGSLLTAEFGADGTVEGNAGCNHFSGPYTIDGDAIGIGPLASTLVACAPSDLHDQEAQYLALLTAADKWSQTAGVLELVDTGGVGRQTTVVFSAATDAAYLGSWEVAGFDDGSGAVVSPVSGSTLTAVFLRDGTIEGNAGCNAFSGPYTAVGTTMTIGPLATTRMACSSPALDTQEQQYLTALQSVAAWEADDGITLRDWDGSTKVSLAAASRE
jgi:heat shock protein HslJ